MLDKQWVYPWEDPPLRQKSAVDLHQGELWKKVGTEKVAYARLLSSDTTPIL